MSIQTFSYTLADGEAVTINRKGDLFSCLAASGGFKVGFDNTSSFDWASGLSLRTPGEFEQVRIVNTSGAANPIQVAIGFGDLRDARLTLGGAVVNTLRTVPDVLTTGAAIAAANAANTLIAAANAQRNEIIIANLGAATVYLNGTPGAIAGQGIPLAGGGLMVLENTAAIYARNDTGGAVNISATESEFTP